MPVHTDVHGKRAARPRHPVPEPLRSALPEEDLLDFPSHPALEKLCFDSEGYFTAHFMRSFRLKRLTLGVPYRVLAHLFRLNWGTVRKWEAGLTRRCTGEMRKYLLAFLSGEFDDRIRRIKWQEDHIAGLQDIPPNLREALCRASNAYILCGNMPGLRRMMLQSMEATIHSVRDRLVSKKENAHEIH